MPGVEMWFPVAIYRQDDLLTEEENEIIKRSCLEIQNKTPPGGKDWVGGTYNTHGTHNLLKDSRFDNLFDKVLNCVHVFAEMHGSNGKYKNNYSWFNISGVGDWQEFHAHNGNIFSAVYYVAAPEGSGKIIFEDPKEPDMCSLKDVPEKNILSFNRVGYKPQARTLLIFRSYLRHLVEPGKNIEPRISIAMNFN